WSRPHQEESGWKHAIGHGERGRHRYPGLAERRCSAFGCRQKRLPGPGPETVQLGEHQLQRHTGTQLDSAAPG
ncbi:hypothetical protein M9458_042267, partial [Cirrhinus mrigala]